MGSVHRQANRLSFGAIIFTLGLVFLLAPAAGAKTFGFTVWVDCYDSDVSSAGTNSTVFVEAWGGGELILRSAGVPDCGEFNDWDTVFQGLTAEHIDSIEEIRIVADGSNAFWMDEIYIDDWVVTTSIGEGGSNWPDLYDTCTNSDGDVTGNCHWGRDGGKGWCVSSDTGDGHGGMWDYIDHDVGCQTCFRFKFDGNAYTCN